MADTKDALAELLDCRGLYCPLPILETRKALRVLAAGQTLKVVATDPGSVADMTAFARLTGHRILDQSEGEGEYTFLIEKV